MSYEIRGKAMSEMILDYICHCKNCGIVFGYQQEDVKENAKEFEYPDNSKMIVKEPYVVCPKCKYNNYFFQSKI